MEKLKKYKYDNDKFQIILEDNETKETRIVNCEKNYVFTFKDVHYIALCNDEETFFFKYNVFCDPNDKKEKPLLLDISESFYLDVKKYYEETVNIDIETKEDDNLIEDDDSDLEFIDLDEDITDYKNKKTKNRKIKREHLVIIIDIILFALLFLLILGVSYFSNRPNNKNEKTVITEESQKNQTKTFDNVSITTYDVSDIVKEVMPSVVSITSISNETMFDLFYGYYENESVGAGSGIIIDKNDKELLIATNSHVVVGSDDLKVYFTINNEETDVKAQIKGMDENSDLAIISVKLEDIESTILDGIKIATIGNSDELELGDPLIAIGNALGYGQSVTTGVVSAKDRKLSNGEGPFIQTDAAINPGNSGGALINSKGEVIGINCSKLADMDIEGIGYAVPSSVFKPILDELSSLETKEKVSKEEKGYIGILGTDVTLDVSEIYGMPVGVFVSELIEDGAASKSLLQPKDIIVKIDKKTVSSMQELQNELDYYKAGDKVVLTIFRFVVNDYEEMEIELTLQKNNK